MKGVCTSCGACSSSIYKQFGKDVIKLTTCEECGDVVDKYIETEFSVIVIDMLLLRKGALRHVLYNSDLQAAWKLVVLFILCDAYEKTYHKYFQKEPFKQGKYIDEVELKFYLMCIKVFLEYFISSILVIIVIYHFQIQRNYKSSRKCLLHSVILASYGKLFMLPVLIWSKNEDNCRFLILLFIFLAQIQVFRVTTSLSSTILATILLTLMEISYVALQYMMY